MNDNIFFNRTYQTLQTVHSIKILLILCADLLSSKNKAKNPILKTPLKPKKFTILFPIYKTAEIIMKNNTMFLCRYVKKKAKYEN